MHPWPFQGDLPFDPHAEFLRIDGQSGTVRPLSSETLVQTGCRMKVSPDGRSLVVAGDQREVVAPVSGSRHFFRLSR